MATLTDRSSSYKFRHIKIGSGGFMMNLSQSNDGLSLFCGGDVYGAYKYNFTSAKWEQLYTTARLPAILHGPDTNITGGCLGVVVAPTDRNIVYMLTAGYCLKSTNGGATFANTGFPRMTSYNPNADPFRIDGPRMAVDPQNPSHVLVGTQKDGLWRTTDGGTNWTRQNDTNLGVGNGVPDAVSPDANNKMRGIIVAFAKVGTVTSGLQTIAYAGSQGNGVYKFNGTSWAAITGAPTYPSNISVAIDDEVYVCAYPDVSNNPGPNVTRITPAGAVSTIGPNVSGRGVHYAMPHPSDAARIVVATQGGHMAQTLNRGTNWSGFSDENAGIRRSTTAPWLQGTNEKFFTTAAVLWLRDNAGALTGKLLFANGISVWETTSAIAPGTVTAPATPPMDFTDIGDGIELMVTNQLHFNGTALLMSLWDRPFFRVAEANLSSATGPTEHGVANWQQHSIIHGWGSDFAKVTIGTDSGEAITDPKQVVIAISDDYRKSNSGYSLDGGVTWTKFAAIPDMIGTATTIPDWYAPSGCIAASTSRNFVWVPSLTNGSPSAGKLRKPHYSLDRGATWTPIDPLPGVSDDGAGYQFSHMDRTLERHIVCADPQTAGTFYYYLYHTTAATGGVFRSTDGGKVWTRQWSGQLGSSDSRWNAKLKAVPGRSGHLVFTPGHAGGGTSGNLTHSTDAGVTWRNIPDLLEAYDVCFGATASGATYPRTFFTGWLNGTTAAEFGTYYSDNFDAATPSWSKMCQFPSGHLDKLNALAAHPTKLDELYLGFDGSTVMYSSLAGLELGPALYSDPDTFYPATLTGGAPRTLQPSLYSDPDAFYTPTVARELRPGGRLRLH